MEERGWGEKKPREVAAAEVYHKKTHHHTVEFRWMRGGDEEQETGSRNKKGSRLEVWCLHRISFRDVVEAVRSSSHPSSSS